LKTIKMPDGIEQRRNSKIITSTLLALLILPTRCLHGGIVQTCLRPRLHGETKEKAHYRYGSGLSIYGKACIGGN
jgi:hypothetical protein